MFGHSIVSSKTIRDYHEQVASLQDSKAFSRLFYGAVRVLVAIFELTGLHR